MTEINALRGAPLPILQAQGATPLPLAGAPLLPAPPDPATSEIRRAAQDFESMFLSEMLAPMFESLDTEGLGGGGLGEQIFRPMLVEQYAKAVANAGGIGLADSVVRELTALQAAIAPPQEAQDGADR
jgi:Rod binding domain-containing protein